MSKIVIALGGNALQSKDSAPTAQGQLEVVKHTCERIADICLKGNEIAIVHGNGPQVGRILLASETAKEVTPVMPFDVCRISHPAGPSLCTEYTKYDLSGIDGCNPDCGG